MNEVFIKHLDSLDRLIEIYIPPKDNRYLNLTEVEEKIRHLFPDEDIQICVS